MTTRANKVYSSLYKKALVLGVPPKFIAIETAVCGIVIFVIRNVIIAILMFILHISLAFLLHKESEISKIVRFWFLMSDKEYMRNKNHAEKFY